MTSKHDNNSLEKEEIRVQRIDAVRHQIDTSIRAYFLWDDFVSALTLAGAAERVLSDLQPQDGMLGVDAYSLRALINLHIKDEFAREAAKYFRAPYDFLRHADRNQSADFVVHPRWIEFIMFLTILAYQKFSESTSRDMKIYLCWCLCRHPEWAKNSSSIRNVLADTGFDTGEISKSKYYELAIAYFAAHRLPD